LQSIKQAGKVCGMTSTTISIDLGNNDSLTRGVFKNADGTFTALTFAHSKTFKTYAGAVRWFKARTGLWGGAKII
jgi:hypothetical protein